MPGIDRDVVVDGGPERAEPVDEQRQLVRHRGPGESCRRLRGKDLRRRSITTEERRRLGRLLKDQSCSGALACAVTWYDAQGPPIEADIRFNVAFKWSTNGASDAFDIQSVAAHEIGHVLQFDHVRTRRSATTPSLLWPYIDIGDTTGRKLGRGDALAANSRY